MQVPMQIAFLHMEPSEAVKALVEEKVAWLEQSYGRITRCRVVLEAPHRHHRHGNHYQVHLDLSVPGGDIVVNRERPQRDSHQDLYSAIQDAFDAARRQLEEFARRHRREVKDHPPAVQARVCRLLPDADHGFLEAMDGREVYFHRNAVRSGDFGRLEIGSMVTYVETTGERGPQARTVRVSGAEHPDQEMDLEDR